MAKEKLYTKERWFADTRKEAEEIVAQAKENDALTMQKIHEKHNSKGFYFLVDLDYVYSTPKEEMDKRPDDDAPEGQMNIDDVQHEGIPYSVNGDGTVEVAATDENE
ncbi:organic solvent tolerance protein OstA [Metasolibacillus meyeri]|uniref:organic solvent tolerance protein OstA n=1 Tax=Metasolibacillus meyeri TaxID=1071052 RepID=UPI000D31387E|nr:organic solvent tolerance protein OstA [Metasolibacillus meyeri]